MARLGARSDDHKGAAAARSLQSIRIYQKMPQLTCLGKDGISRVFEYRSLYDANASLWTYRVTTIPPPTGGHFFELQVSDLDAHTVRVVVAQHFHRPKYRAMGIPDALLPAIRNDLSRIVQSSPSYA